MNKIQIAGEGSNSSIKIERFRGEDLRKMKGKLKFEKPAIDKIKDGIIHIGGMIPKYSNNDAEQKDPLVEIWMLIKKDIRRRADMLNLDIIACINRDKKANNGEGEIRISMVTNFLSLPKVYKKIVTEGDRIVEMKVLTRAQFEKESREQKKKMVNCSVNRRTYFQREVIVSAEEVEKIETMARGLYIEKMEQYIERFYDEERREIVNPPAEKLKAEVLALFQENYS